jgi:predicted dehydrogenase
MLLRVAVVGAGSISREYALRHLIEDLGVTVVAVIDSNISLAESLARDVTLRKAGAKVVGTKYRETVEDGFNADSASDVAAVMATTTLDSVLDMVDMCYIGTPPNTHAELALASLAAKKHVLLEKPIAVTDVDTESIVAAAAAAELSDGLVVNINIGMRYSAAAIEMKRRLAANSLGQLESMELRLLFRQWPREWQTQPWVAGRGQGGPLLEVGTHWIFGLLEIVGHDNVRAVHCTPIYPDGPEGELCEVSCSGYIELTSGLRVAIDVQAQSEEAQSRGQDIYELWARGSEGSLVLYDFSKLRDGSIGADVLVGGYGRQECVGELVSVVRGADRTHSNLVTPQQAQNVQRIIASMRSS